MNTPSENSLSRMIIDRVHDHLEKIHEWLKSYEGSNELPLYSSVDIRDAGFKTAVVDTNIFPAGFNNLSEQGIEDATRYIQEAIIKRVPHCRNILIVAEEHTRNTWYLENIRILQSIIERAGFQSKIATFLTVQPEFCKDIRYAELETATGQTVRIHCFQRILEDYESGKERYCLIILNNDLTGGIPEILKKSQVPIYPSIQAGWHARLKSHHFRHASDLLSELADILDIDPWLLSCEFDFVKDADINSDATRKELKDKAEALFAKIQAKYDEHHIPEKPYLVMKSDSGTYGMGVVPVESPDEILALNRKRRNSLTTGKSAQPISRIFLQEGVPTIHNINDRVSEVCYYQIDNHFIGGFFRSHSSKGNRDNLNTSGMNFTKMEPHHPKYDDHVTTHEFNIFDVYHILARIGGIAAHREIIHLEANSQ